MGCLDLQTGIFTVPNLAAFDYLRAREHIRLKVSCPWFSAVCGLAGTPHLTSKRNLKVQIKTIRDSYANFSNDK